MPVYNGAEFLHAAVQSVLQQTFKNFELLCVDDGSDDAGPMMLESFVSQDARVSLHRLPHVGISAALNHGISLARGEYIARMDSDDLSHPERFAEQVAYLDAHPEVVALGSAACFIDRDGRALGPWRPVVADAEIRVGLGRGEASMIHPAMMLRRSAVLSAGGYQEEYNGAEDYELWCRLAKVGSLANLSRMLLEYRIHGASISVAQIRRQLQLTERIMQAWSGKRLDAAALRLRRLDLAFHRAELYLRADCRAVFESLWQLLANEFPPGPRRRVLVLLSRLHARSFDARNRRWRSLAGSLVLAAMLRPGLARQLLALRLSLFRAGLRGAE
jgi:glycosyltransferase involved in cell wall biosynthesis